MYSSPIEDIFLPFPDEEDFNVGDFDIHPVPPGAIPPDMLDIDSICGSVVVRMMQNS